MTVSDAEDGTVRLRTHLYCAIAASRGYPTAVSQARLHGIGRSTMYRLLGGGAPGAVVAMRMADDLGVPVEQIWELVTLEQAA